MTAIPFRDDRCDRHQQAETAPQLCAICQRIDVEHKIVNRVVSDLLAAGYTLSSPESPKNLVSQEASTGLSALMADLFSCDDAVLRASRDGKSGRWVRFIYGNGGWDVISDYTTSLDADMQGAMAYAQTFDDSPF